MRVSGERQLPACSERLQARSGEIWQLSAMVVEDGFAVADMKRGIHALRLGRERCSVSLSPIAAFRRCRDAGTICLPLPIVYPEQNAQNFTPRNFRFLLAFPLQNHRATGT